MKYSLPILFVIAILGISLLNSVTPAANNRFATVNSAHEVGFRAVKCWFTAASDWPASECYYMQVPESHSPANSRMISFPVVVFKSRNAPPRLAPVLHLGAGGPGAPMYLDDDTSVEQIWQFYDALSLKRGRDLIAIDPRGAGLAKPLLTCNHFVDGELARFQKNISVIDEINSINADYYKCIAEYQAQGIDLTAYNSSSVARDVETMRKAAKIEKWVLVGVSYSAVYAQSIASAFPHTVESMVLDSSTMPQIRLHERFLEQTMGPYNKLFGYCEFDPKCTQSISNVEDRIWKLYESLNKNPLPILFEHHPDTEKISMKLNGIRFLAALMQGVYGVEIFKDLPAIIDQLESGGHDRLNPYLWLHVDYMLDRTYGDVSAITHYCFDEKPSVDLDKIAGLVDQLPAGHLRNLARIGLTQEDFCERLQTRGDPGEKISIESIATPTLFLHGNFDTVTPLSSVLRVKSRFKSHRLVTFNLAHSIISNSECAEIIAGRFVADPFLAKNRLDCEDPE